MSELDEKETLEQLSNMREEIDKLVKSYNVLARNKNQNTRIAYATASSYSDDDKNVNYEKTVNDHWGENVGISIESPEAGQWFPSSIC